jgi:hypothetical protein
MNKGIIPIQRVQQRILYLRGQKVLLDRDLAMLYGVETRVLSQAVKRNADRFPKDFVFTLSREEIRRISQIVTSFSGLKFSKQVNAFTEEGMRVGKHDEKIDVILEAIRQLMAPPEKPRREIGFHVRETPPRYRMQRH